MPRFEEKMVEEPVCTYKMKSFSCFKINDISQEGLIALHKSLTLFVFQFNV